MSALALAALAWLCGPSTVMAGALEQAFHTSRSGSVATIDHSAWAKLLSTYVVAEKDGLNRVDYAAFKKSGHTDLKSYVAALETVDPATLDRPEQFAFWANLYNAKTIDVVLDHYPVASIKDIKLSGFFKSGPWSKSIMKVKGVALSLDDIEHGILRPYFKDPRVHYAVNCASVGCPNLGREPFTGARLDKQLDAAARAFINHPRGFRAQDGSIIASKIFSWFVKDFGGDAAGVLAHARKYATGPLATALAKAKSIGDYEYDWSLNDAKRAQR
jgi:hypothetical protein